MKRTKIEEKAARYHKIVEWSDEDRCFVGTCPELMFGGVHGQDETKVYAELRQAVQEVIEILETDGQPLPEALAGRKFSGRFVLRVEPSLHKRLVVKAHSAGESLNTLCAKALAKA
jgi:predicted HicB family RNase H-like nuclease